MQPSTNYFGSREQMKTTFKNVSESVDGVPSGDTGIVSIYWENQTAHVRIDGGMKTAKSSKKLTEKVDIIGTVCTAYRLSRDDIEEVKILFNMSDALSQFIYDYIDAERISDEQKIRLIGTNFIPNFG